MTFREAYTKLAADLGQIYDDREGSIIARYLLEDAFGVSFWSEELLQEGQIDQLAVMTDRLKTYEPWQYVGGMADFFGLKFKVTKDVLIPRPETEELVHYALPIFRNHKLKSLLDIGTGSGIIPITMSLKVDIEKIFAIDISDAAIKVARENNQLHHTDVDFLQVDFLDKTSWSSLPKVDMIISNPPYITDGEKKQMHPNVLDHEPHVALFVNQDAMEFYQAIAEFTLGYQASGCIVLMEINENYGKEVVDIFSEGHFCDVTLIKDLQGKDRIVMARKK
ncbi:MAG TPA: peptide chain release factor N(5)-glutamine methyltransferase [Saprospiraceae bacterium]|nr:peptide chain release factor N(5)-glutamine methyltransferase [Saprospiraceae bacterium]